MGKRVGNIIFLSVIFAFYSSDEIPNLEYSLRADSGIEHPRYYEQTQKLSVSTDFGKIPLYFIPNEGQVNERAQFYAKTSRYTLWMTSEGLVFDSSRKLESETDRQKNFEELNPKKSSPKDAQAGSYERDVSRLIFLNTKENSKAVPLEMTENRVNYFIGCDKEEWKTDLATSKSVLYKDLYKKIDLKVYGIENQIEYDWIVKAGGDPEEIAYGYKGVDATEIDEHGNLLVKTKFGELIHRKPVSYQVVGGERIDVDSNFKYLEKDTYGFEVNSYDKKYDLVIDPVILVYSTYLGGSGFDSGQAIAVDSSGCAYVTGSTSSIDFPLQNSYQSDQWVDDVFVTKLTSAGNGLLYSTYLGGGSYDYGLGIAVDSSGSAYITGSTYSTNFPTQNPFQTDQADGDVFLTKLSSSGNSLSYSTYLGGGSSEGSSGIAVDSFGCAYVTGVTESTDFPTLNPYQTDQDYDDVFVTKFSSSGSSLSYSTYIGGSGSESSRCIAVDSSGSAYIAGDTWSADFPLQNPYQAALSLLDVFVVKLSSSGNSLSYSTFIGGSAADCAYGIAVDSSGSAYIAGETSSTDFPIQNPCQTDQGLRDVFVTKLSPSGNILVYSTYLGGSDFDLCRGIALDSTGCAFVTGETHSSDFPTLKPFQTDQGDRDVFITKLSPSGNSLACSTYLGGCDRDYGQGIAIDSLGSIYVTGSTLSTDFPSQNPYQYDQGGYDVFVTKLVESIGPVITLSKTQLNFGADTSAQKTTDQNFSITNSGEETLEWSITDNAGWLSCDPIFGSEYASISVSVDHTGLSAGMYNAIITITSPNALNSPQDIAVTLIVYDAGTDGPPFGCLDTPIDGATVSGSLPITGWALDDIEVTKVEIKRDPDPDDPPEAIGPDGLILISWPSEGKNNVIFVPRARPDVEALYPTYPLNDRAGWGYLMLAYGLPRQGNGTFRLYAFAEDETGHRVLLGTKQITSDNANRVNPFGTIDTPNQGEVISGASVNFGWALTPLPKMIPTDGSTIWISIDGVYIAHPVYNQFRQDIYDAFPSYLNSGGAVGYYYFDSTAYTNGVHNIGWYAVDDNGDADGFGSRFFEIQNAEGSPALQGGLESLNYRVDRSGRMRIDVEGPRRVEAEQLERLKIVFKAEGGDRIIGWGADETKGLPIGSTLDSEEGVFYWSIGPGFLNRHILHFAATDGEYKSEPAQIVINVVPKRFDSIRKHRK